MLITKEVEVRLNGHNVNYYRQLGYDIPMREACKAMKYQGVEYVADCEKTILVKIQDLPLNSRTFVESTCDYCGEPKPPTKYSDYNRQTKNGTLKCCCAKCASLKHKEIMLEKYGYEGTMQVPEIREKAYKTCSQKYGYESPFQSLKVREKIAQILYTNTSQKSSKQQRYINNLYYGVLNYPIKCYFADIYLSDDNLIIEFDGSGHALSVVMKSETEEEFKRKEIIRYKLVKKEGYKQMRIISLKDRLPSDQILLQMLDDARNYFAQFPNHHWIEFDIDDSIIRNAEYKSGIQYDYGKLRKIKDSDLSKFVAQLV